MPSPSSTALSISDLEVRDIGFHEACDFIVEHHYSGGCAWGSMTWGLYVAETDELLGAIAFHTPCSENVRRSIFEDMSLDADDPANACECDHIDEDHYLREHVTELHRLVTLDHAPHNAESWFIARALKALKAYKPKYWAVVSFADQTEGHVGTIYQATNALYYGSSGKARFYRDTDGRLRHPRYGGENISVEEARERGWTSEMREPKHRYLFLLPDPYQPTAELEGMLQVEVQPYPKLD